MEYYLIAKALHIVAFTSWMAAMFYLPRLLAYHAEVATSSAESEKFKIMERRLLKVIMTPAMIATWVFGIWLVVITGYGGPNNPAMWLNVKLLLVLGLSGLHGFFAASVRKFANGMNQKSPRFYKIVNELVTIMFVAIVFLVVIKPLL
ncbi:MAG: CopD family protein [Rickettsiales bacterium]|nr:CopD family protein [Rickettsiales bacterium]